MFGWAFIATCAVCTILYPCIRFPSRTFNIILCFPAFVFCGMSFFCAQSIRSFCNFHDVAWGTKGLDDSPKTAGNKINLLMWRFLPITVVGVANAAIVLVFMDGPQKLITVIAFYLMCSMMFALTIMVYLLIWCRYVYRPSCNSGPSNEKKKPQSSMMGVSIRTEPSSLMGMSIRTDPDSFGRSNRTSTGVALETQAVQPTIYETTSNDIEDIPCQP